MQNNQWAMDGGFWYYLGADGKLITDSYSPDGYYIGPDGKWVESVSNNNTSSYRHDSASSNRNDTNENNVPES